MEISMLTQKLFARVREKAVALGVSLKLLMRASILKLVGDDAEQWIEEFDRLSGSGHSDGSRFDRYEIHER